MLGICTPQMHTKHRPLAAMPLQEITMSIKGIKEALARKKQSQQPGQTQDDLDIKVTRVAPVKVAAKRPPKRATGRGR